jgi:hypothetical protein
MRKRLPALQDMLQVYAVIAVMFTGWTLTAFLWKFSAWILLLNLGELVVVFSYAMAANFVESLLLLSFLLTLCVLLPARALRDDFVVRGTILTAGLIGSLMAFVGSRMQFGLDSGLRLLIAPAAVLLVMVFLLHRLSQYSRVRSIAMWFSDRLVVFLYILVPLFAVAAMYVIYRNVA